MPDILNVAVRWLHISSAMALIGGILYARLVAIPAMRKVAPMLPVGRAPYLDGVLCYCS